MNYAYAPTGYYNYWQNSLGETFVNGVFLSNKLNTSHISNAKPPPSPAPRPPGPAPPPPCGFFAGSQADRSVRCHKAHPRMTGWVSPGWSDMGLELGSSLSALGA